jgi:hypothetical protein
MNSYRNIWPSKKSYQAFGYAYPTIGDRPFESATGAITLLRNDAAESPSQLRRTYLLERVILRHRYLKSEEAEPSYRHTEILAI